MNARLNLNADAERRIREEMLNRLRRRNRVTALDRDFYTSAEDYRLDLDMIWYRDWLFVGHDCEVLNPGNYLTVQVGEYPIVVVRDREGEFARFTTRAGTAARASVRRNMATHRAWSAPIINGPTVSTGACWRRATWAAHSTIAIWLETGALRRRRRLHLGVPGAGGAGFRAGPADTSAVLPSPQAA